MEIDITNVISIAKEAGKEILKIYKKDFSVNYKKEGSPLTEADIASHNLIIKMLKKNYPKIPILSEESKEIEYSERKNWNRFWLIDPLDGTKEFVKKKNEFTVNIALIREGKPILGVVYVPVKDLVYFSDGKESLKQFDNGEIKKLPLEEGKDNKENKLRVVASKSHFSEETKNYIESLGKEYELISIGSSLKLCMVAEGKADIYPRLGPTMEWDTAAAHAIVNGAGKKVYKFGSKEELEYNKENLKNPWFVVK